MWNTELMNEITKIYNGESGSDKEQHLIRNYMVFDGMSSEVGNYCYDLSYQSVADMMAGRKHNPFLYISCSIVNDKCVYVREEN